MVNTKQRIIGKSQACLEQGEDDPEFFFSVSVDIFRHTAPYVCVCVRAWVRMCVCLSVYRRIGRQLKSMAFCPVLLHALCL